MDSRGHCSCVERIADAKRRFQIAVCNTSLGPFFNQVENCSAGSLTACTRRGWNSDEGMKRCIDCQAFAEWSIDKVEKVVVCQRVSLVLKKGRIRAYQDNTCTSS